MIHLATRAAAGVFALSLLAAASGVRADEMKPATAVNCTEMAAGMSKMMDPKMLETKMVDSKVADAKVADAKVASDNPDHRAMMMMMHAEKMTIAASKYELACGKNADGMAMAKAALARATENLTRLEAADKNNSLLKGN